MRFGLMLAVAILAACSDRAPPPEATRHRCVEIPNGLVECTPLPPGEGRPAPSPR